MKADGTLNWVSNAPTEGSTSNRRYGVVSHAMKRCEDMIGVKHLYEGHRGTLRDEFYGTSSSNFTRRKYPFGELIVYFPPHTEGTSMFYRRSDKHGELCGPQNNGVEDFTSLWEQPKTRKHDIQTGGYKWWDSVGINYHTFRQMVTYTRGQYPCIEQLMEEHDIGTELIGMTDDHRLLYGFKDNFALQCLITLDSLNGVVKTPEYTDERYLDSDYYYKWLDYSNDYCEARDLIPSTKLGFVFQKYWNSGLVTQDDINEYERLA